MAALIGRHRWLNMLQLGLFDSTPPPADRQRRTPEGTTPALPPAGRVQEAGPPAGPTDKAGSSADVPLRDRGGDEQRGSGPTDPVDVPQPAPTVEYVRHPKARRYLLRVRADGSVRVTIPRRGSRREAVEFYEQHLAWVATQQVRVAELRKRLPADLPADEQRRLRRKAAKELPERLHQLAARVGLSVRRVSVRDQKHRWGSCSTSGLICLNWRLVTMPDWVRDYVIYHELMHLKRMDHSPAFWKLVSDVCPNFREARRWLRTHALAPHAGARDGSG